MSAPLAAAQQFPDGTTQDFGGTSTVLVGGPDTPPKSTVDGNGDSPSVANRKKWPPTK
jgi:hypothetical protein